MKKLIPLIAILIVAQMPNAGFAWDIKSYGDYKYVLHNIRNSQSGYFVDVAVFDALQPIKNEADPDFEFGFRHVVPLSLSLLYGGIPSVETITAAAEARIQKYHEQSLIPVVYDEQIFISEVEAILKEKGYLEDGQHFEDLPILPKEEGALK